MGLKSNVTGVLIRRHRDTQGQHGMGGWGRKWGDELQAKEPLRIDGHHQKQGRGKWGFMWSLRGSMALLTSWFGTSGFQNYARINFCCFSPQFVVLGYSSPRNAVTSMQAGGWTHSLSGWTHSLSGRASRARRRTGWALHMFSYLTLKTVFPSCSPGVGEWGGRSRSPSFLCSDL